MNSPRIDLPGAVNLSRLVYGAWRLGDGANSSAAHTTSLIDACLAQSITTFDHADIYGDYRCEALFGDALRQSPALAKRMEIVTKCDIMLISQTSPTTRVKHYDTTPEHVRASVDRSLQRLSVGHIDLLLLHRPDPLMDPHTVGPCLDALIDSGKVRAAGVSNFMPWDVDALQASMKHRLATNQIELNLLRLAPGDNPFTNGQVVHAQQKHMPLMAWSPLAGGRLMRDEPAAQRLRPALNRIADAHAVDVGAVAVAWLLHHPVQVMPIFGTTDSARAARLSDALKVTMDRQTWYELYTLGLGREVP
jgi:predicted oxidoreductase